MKAFSFLSILKNFGKQLSSLASQMPWCNLRFNLGSISVLSRVNPLFSRRASHFAAILTILFTVGVGNMWGATPAPSGLHNQSSLNYATTDTIQKDGKIYEIYWCNSNSSNVKTALSKKTYGSSNTEATGTDKWCNIGSSVGNTSASATAGTIEEFTWSTSHQYMRVRASDQSNYQVVMVVKGYEGVAVLHKANTNLQIVVEKYNTATSAYVAYTPATSSTSEATNSHYKTYASLDKSDQFRITFQGSGTGSTNRDMLAFSLSVTASPCSATANAGADKSTTVGVGVAMAATAASSGYTGAWSIKDGSPSTETSQLSSTSLAKATFTPTAAGTYTLVWTVTDDSDGSCSATDEATVTVTAPTHTVTATTDNASYGTAAAASGTVMEGLTTTITATPNSGYQFDHWTVSGTGASLSSTTTNPTTLTMGTSDVTVTAYFVEKTCPSSGTLYSAVAAATGNISIAGNTSDLELNTSTHKTTVTGGSMYVTSQQTGSKNLITANGFTMTNNNTFFKIVLDCELAAGDIISIAVGKDGSNARGVWVSSASSRPGSAPACALTATNASLTPVTYTVTGSDEYHGKTVLYIYRATANTTYFNNINISRPAAPSCTAPTITFSNGSYTVGGSALNLSELFTSNSTGEVTYTVTTANETGATIDGTSFTATAAGTATVKATQAANGNYCSGEATATITVNAAPEPETYSITYNENRPTNAWNAAFAVKNIPAEQTLTGGTGTVSNNTPTITEDESSEYAIYTFNNWNTAADGKGTSYAAGAAITITENTTLYAQWTPRIYNITYYDTDKTTVLDLEPKNYTYGEGVASLPTPTKDGYTFSSWTKWWDGGEESNVSSISNTTWGDANLAAQWTAKEYDINYKDQGNADFSGTHGANHPTKHTYGTATALVEPTKANYEFEGWYTTSECTGSAVTSLGATAYTANITLYAKWTQVIVSVESVEVNPSSKTIEIDAKQQLTATITPDNATNTNVTWSSSNESVATVDENTGVVTAVGAGEATITATTEDGNKTDQCEITVEKIKPEKYNFSINKTELCGDEKATLTLVNSQSNVTYELREDSDTPIAETEKQGTGSALTWNVGAGTYVVFAKETNKYSERQMDGSKIDVAVITAVTITTQPSNSSAQVGEQQSLTVVASGESLSYQWMQSTAQNGEYTDVASNGTSATYTTTPSVEGTTWYKVEVTNGCGSIISDAVSITATPIEIPEPSGECEIIVKATPTGETSATVSGSLKGNAYFKGQTDYKLGSTGHYIGVSLVSGETFQSGDKIILDVEKVNDASKLYLYSDAGKTALVTLSITLTTGENKFDIPNEVVGESALYIYRVDSKCNPTINSFAVCRPTTPEPTTYTVTVNSTANGTVTADKTTGVAQGETVTLSVNPASGYELETLTVKDASENDVNVTDNTFTMPASNVIVSATFTAIETPEPGNLYTVTFDTNGGSEVSPITQASVGVEINLPTPTKDGYEFVGWYIGGELVTANKYTPTADITATAAWKENCNIIVGGEETQIYTTYFIENPEGATVESGKIEYKTTVETWATDYDKYLVTTGSAGYYQLNFNSSLDLSGYANKKMKVYWASTKNRPLKVSINGGDFTKIDEITSESERSLVREIEMNISTISSLSSIKFISDGGGAVYLFKVEIIGTSGGGGGTCYYVTYNGNGADGGYVNDANAYAANEEVTTLANGFTRAGYTFTGWNTAADGSGASYAAGGTFTITGNTELFAQWIENTDVDVDLSDCTEKTITYNLLTPNNTTPSQTVSPAGVITELTGATAQGTATTNTDGINNKFADYSVRYGASEGSDNAENGVIFTFTVPTGYVFKPSAISSNLMCYGKGKNGETQNYEFYGTLSDGATTINGTALPGTADGANADIVYSDIADKTLSGTVTLRLNAVKVGGSNQSFRIKSPITIVGKLCSAQTYTITYDNNGGDGDMESTSNVVAENTFTRDGYTFAGWNTAEDGTGTSYAAGEIVASNLTLYAQWKCIKPEFTVSYGKTEYTINDDDAEAITVTVTAGNSGGVTYQWYSSTTNDRNNGTAITGKTEASYTPSTATEGTIYYWCEIENTCTSVQTAMIAITVREDKSNPSVKWTNPSDVNYGGGNYSISATVNDGWDGTLLPSMLTAPTGINLYDIEIDGKEITAIFDVTTTFDRTAGNTIPFVLTLPETTTYNPLVSENEVDYDACATRGGSEYVIPVLNGAAEKDGNYYYWSNEYGWVSPSPNNSCSGKAQATTFADGEKFDYVHGSNSQTTFVRTFKAGIDKVRIYANFRAPNMTVTEVYKHSDYFSINNNYKLNISDYSIIYNGDEDAESLSAESESFGFVDIILKTPLNQNDIIALKFSTDRVRVQGAAIIEQSAGTIETTLSFATAGSITKTQNDANFTNKATPSNNTLGTITYSSSNTSVATVNPTTGEVSIIAAGTTTITATLDLSGCYKGAMATYELTVNEQICAIAAGTLSASKTDKYDCEEVTLTLSNYEPDATIEWWHNGEAITSKSGITINGNILTTTLEGTYSALVTKDCNVRSNSVTITNIASASATPLVNEWYVKNGRLTPEIALWKLEGGARIVGVEWIKGEESSTAPYDDPKAIYVENGIVYLTGTPPQANETGKDIRYTIQLSIKNSCDDSPMVVPSTITIIHQKNTDKHVLAFVVTGKEKGGFTEGIPAAQTTSVPLYTTISHNFEVLATNIYATDNEQLLKEYYSQFDIICITDYPNTKTKGVNGKSYTDAMGSLIDIRPILSMEAWVSNYTNWNNKGVTGDPKSPTTRQYSMLLQCKDHEIFAGTSLVSEDVDGETMYRVTMVDKNKEDYVTLDNVIEDPHQEKEGYKYGSNPALQGFTYTSSMSSMLPIGIIDDGAGKGNNLQVGLERQHEIEARMMVIGVNSYAMERLTDDGEKVIINALKYLMKKNAEDISDCSIYFDNNEGTGDGLWSSPVNWGPSRNSLPQSSQEARILAPCVVSDYTAKVASVKIVTDGTYKYQSMDGTANGSLTIAPNGALVVKGRIQAATAPNYLETRNTDVKDLVVQSDATGNGALIHGEIGEAIGATVELLSKAYSVREYNESTGKYKKKKYWQYVALPVQNALAEDAFWGAYTYQYDETQGWIKKGTGENIEEFWGIGLSIDNEVYSGANNETSLTKFTIKGNLALATDRDIDLTRTTNAGEGQNMIGNSWTAPIHLTSMTEDDFENAVATVYIYNTGRDEQASGKEGTASSANGSTQAGQWISIPIAPTKLDPWQGPKVIPSMQAFEVDLVEGKTSGVLHLNYDKHVRTIATPEEENLPLRAPKYLGNEPSMIRLRVADSITYTDLYLIEGDQFTDEFDNAWDGKYQPCDGRSATLYAMSPIGDMAVLAQPSVNNTSVVFEPGKKSEYVFTFGYNGDVTYYLNDMQLKTSTEIKEGNEYRFTYNKGDMKNRFLVTRESFDSPNISTGLANIVTDGNGLQVTNPNQENLQVILIDAAGRMCSIYNTAEPMFKVELPATQGVYMINVKGETTNIVRKVVK